MKKGPVGTVTEMSPEAGPNPPPVTQHGTFVTLCYPWPIVFRNLSWYPQEETKEHKGLAMVCVSNCIATVGFHLALPWHVRNGTAWSLPPTF